MSAALFIFAQQITHEAVVVNIEVQVRVFRGSRFIDDLTKNDFLIYEDGKPQEIDAVYLIKKTKIEREDTEMKPEVARQTFAPDTSRSIVLNFDMKDYLPKNVASMFKRASDATENYYLLYYTPKDYTMDGKFKTIEVKVKGKNYRITHRQGYFAN